VLETGRLLLREFGQDDAPAIERVLGDAEVMRYGSGTMGPAEVAAWLRARREEYARWGFGLWAVVERSCGEVIGYCGLTHYDDVCGRPEVEIGYRLARAWWGRGLASEAAAAVRDHAFSVLGLPRVIALVDPGNVASIRVATRLGMRHEKDAMLPGYTHPDRVYVVRARVDGDPGAVGLVHEWRRDDGVTVFTWLGDADVAPDRVYAFAFTAGGDLVLVSDAAWRPAGWLPGGGVEPGETPGQALARELEEEAGAVLLRCAPLGTQRSDDSALGRRYPAFFWCRVEVAPGFTPACEVTERYLVRPEGFLDRLFWGRADPKAAMLLARALECERAAGR